MRVKIERFSTKVRIDSLIPGATFLNKNDDLGMVIDRRFHNQHNGNIPYVMLGNGAGVEGCPEMLVEPIDTIAITNNRKGCHVE